jgi:hypothetical protein
MFCHLSARLNRHLRRNNLPGPIVALNLLNLGITGGKSYLSSATTLTEGRANLF